MKKFKIFLLLLTLLSCNSIKNEKIENELYQSVLSKFFSEYWNEKIFIIECNGIKFDEKSKIAILNHTIKFGSVSNVNVVREKKDNNLVLHNQSNLNTYSVNGWVSIKREEDYFLRMSNIAEDDGGNLYVCIWIKQSYYSSGLRYVFQVNEGKIKLFTIIMSCDDWG